MWSGRRLSIKTAVVGLVLGAVLTGLVAYMLPAPPAMPAPAQTTAQTVAPAPPRPAARIAPLNPGANPGANPGQQPGFATATGIPRPGDTAVEATDPGFVPPSRDPTDSAPGPEYPPDAARRGQEGVVQLLVYVETDGHVAAIAVARGSGFPDLDVAAEQAVRQWHFRPATRDGVPVANSTTVTMRFILHR
jgi:protein TonB